MGTVSQIRAAGEKYLGADAAPDGLASYWSARAGRALAARPHELAEVGIDTPVAAYRELSFASTDGQGVRARVLLPKAEARTRSSWSSTTWTAACAAGTT